MKRKSLLNNFLVGPAWIDSRIEYKQAILRGQLAALLIFIAVFYIILDPLYGFYKYIIWYCGAIVISLLAIYFNRLKKHQTASIILLLYTNIIVFLVADASDVDNGVFFFFSVIAVVSLSLFYNTNLRIGLSFALLSILLGVTAYFNDHSFLEHTSLPIYVRDMNFTINFVLGVLTAILVVLFVIRRNKESEDSLMASKIRLENLAQELSAKNKDLVKANDELDRFVYSASHDMRAPLSTLLGLIQVAKIDNDPKEHEQYFDLMTNRIHDMEGFIKEITDYSRNTRLAINNETINLKDLLNELKESFVFLANESSVQVEINVDDTVEINSDKSRLHIVLNNLLANSIKYHDPHKDNRFVKLTTSVNNGIISIDIEDNGIGIAYEYQDKIFDMFFRATERSKGSGLGLYIAKETSDKLGGLINFKSQPGTGSIFSVEFAKIDNSDS